MTRRALLGLSAALGAFVLVLVGAAGGYSLRTGQTDLSSSADTVPIDVVRAREARYRQLLDEANARRRAPKNAVAAAPAATPRIEAFLRPHEDDDDGHHRHAPRRSHHEDDDG